MKNNKTLKNLRSTPRIMGLTTIYFFLMVFLSFTAVMLFFMAVGIMTLLISLTAIIGGYVVFWRLSNKPSTTGADISVRSFDTTKLWK